MVDIGDIGVVTFAHRVQALLVDYLRAKHGENVPIGVVTFGRVSGTVSALRMLGMPVATATLESRSHGVTSRTRAVLGAHSLISWARYASSSARCLGRSICNA